MTHYTELPEAYPGQHARIAADLAHAARERAAEARHGGRYITETLARVIRDDAPIRSWFAGESGPDKLAEIWRFAASPSGSEYPASGRDTTARYARGQAENGGAVWAHSAYWLAPKLPESAFDWPIYRVAVTARCADSSDCTSPAMPGSAYCRDHNGLVEDYTESELRALHGDR